MTKAKLEVIAPADEPVIITHRFIGAPPALVFEAWTTPEHMRQWIGPRALTMVSCEVDLRVGGRYRFVHRAPDRPHRMVCTSVFDMMPEHEAVETLTLEAKEGGTLITTHTKHGSLAARDGHLSNGGMEAGMTDGYERLEDLLSRMEGR